MRAARLLLALCFAGCGDDTTSPTDLATSSDFAAPATPDLANADLAVADLAAPDLASADFAGTDLAIQFADAGFVPVIRFAAGVPYNLWTADGGVSAGPSALAIGDVNGDGSLDVVTNYLTFTTLFGDGTGALGAPVTDTISFTSVSDLVALDGDGDGKADLFANTYLDHPVVEYLTGSGDGTFVYKTAYYQCGGHAYGFACAEGFALGDLNGDGHTDLVVSILDQIAGTTSASVLLWTSAGTFGSGTSGQGPIALTSGGFTVADFDGDHKADVLSAGDGAYLLKGNGAGGLANAVSVASGTGLTTIAAGDFFGNGINDALAGDGNLQLLTGSGSGTFTSTFLASGGSVVRIAAADFDRDGRTDVVYAVGSPPQLTVVTWKPDGSYATVVVPTSLATKSLAIGDLNKDGKPDVVTVDGANVVVYLDATP